MFVSVFYNNVHYFFSDVAYINKCVAFIFLKSFVEPFLFYFTLCCSKSKFDCWGRVCSRSFSQFALCHQIRIFAACSRPMGVLKKTVYKEETNMHVALPDAKAPPSPPG